MPSTARTSEPVVTLQIAQEHGLLESEYQQILEILGRTPTWTELGLYSVMWSEHCSYKNSILELKKLPRSGGRLLVEAGAENAGLVDIGDGLAIAFKIESHNHPSAVEPHQGAATGVGGILRDIFTMGARPLANLVSLRFGKLDNDRTRYLVDGVVRGIGDYGNCMGIPTVAGEVTFDESYHVNPLVNAMTVGVVKVPDIISASASGVGNLVYYIGNKTGRDGIHGATFASDELTENSTSKRPNVQVGDPFTEKLLLEATLELSEKHLLVALQDMGAAGLACSTTEMAARGDVSMEIELSKVPQREPGMTPYELMLSESQERMLAVCEQKNAKAFEEICHRWGIACVPIGKIISGAHLKLHHHGELVAELPASTLVLGGGAPQYLRDDSKPASLDVHAQFDPLSIDYPDNATCFSKLWNEPTLASKRWVYRQFDFSVRGATVKGPGEADAAVVWIPGTNKGFAAKCDCNPYWVALDPELGTKHAVAEGALNVACTGATPVAITNCLNFGNPYKPEAYYYFRRAIAGMGEACRKLNTPVSGGNVSFYNESPEGSVIPTPTIGMLGVFDEIKHHCGAGAVAGSELWLLGDSSRLELGGSAVLRAIHGKNTGAIPKLDLDQHQSLISLLTNGISDQIIQSAHDCSDGGLAHCLAEMAVIGKSGIKVNEIFDNRLEWFGESASRVVVCVTPENSSTLKSLASKFNVPAKLIGTVTGSSVSIGNWLDVPVRDLAAKYETIIDSAMGEVP